MANTAIRVLGAQDLGAPLPDQSNPESLSPSAGGERAYLRPGPETTAHIWPELRAEVALIVQSEPIMEAFLHAMVLDRDSFRDALAHAISAKLADANLAHSSLRGVLDAAYADNPTLVHFALLDMQAVRFRDPASQSYYETLLYFKGFLALQGYRIAHWLWSHGRKPLALLFQSRISQLFGVDIHPAARIGTGIMIDHATGVVIGETAVVEDNVSMLHEVTLGGTGKDHGDRHPKVGRGVLIGAGAKLLGNVSIGTGAKIGAGSVVLDNVREHCTVAGVPAINVGGAGCEDPALEMDHRLPV